MQLACRKIGRKDYGFGLPRFLIDEADMGPDRENRASGTAKNALRLRSEDELTDAVPAMGGKHNEIRLFPGDLSIDDMPWGTGLQHALVPKRPEPGVGLQLLHVALALLHDRVEFERNGFHR